MKRYCDQQHEEVTFEPRQYVYLKIDAKWQRAIRKRFNFKLAKKYYDPFKKLQRIGKVAYQLELPASSQLHPVFHVSWLKERIGDPTEVVQDLPILDEEDRLLL